MSSLLNKTWSPSDYDEASVIAREAGNELIARLDWMTIKPAVILDAGCGTGEFTAKLQSRFKDAHVIALDHHHEMLDYAKQHHSPSLCVLSDAMTLPLRDHSVDFIFANFLLPWLSDTKTIFREWLRVLRPNGLLMFSALGLDTLKEWREVNLIPTILDMHEIGDELLRVGLADPVLDVDYYTLTYRSKERMIHELCATGMWKSAGFDVGDKPLEVSYEVVFAHAFAPLAKAEFAPSADGTVRIPLKQLRKKFSTAE